MKMNLLVVLVFSMLSWNQCNAFTRTPSIATSSFLLESSLQKEASPLANRPRTTSGTKKGSTTARNMMMDGSEEWLTGTATSISMALSSVSSQPLLTEDDIAMGFKVATFGPQLFWLLLILLPNSGITKRVMGGYEVLLGFSLVHFFIVVASLFQDGSTVPMAEFANVFDFDQSARDNQAAMSNMFTYPNFVAEEWSHVLTWDLFVGRWIWLDGLRRDIFTIHSVLLCNLIGPPGFLLHIFTCLVTGKAPFPSNEAISIDTKSDEN